MKRYIKIIIGIGFIVPSLTAFANLDVHPYLGVNIGMKHSRFASNNGGNIFKSNYPVGGLFVGVEFLPELSLELNLESTVSKKKKSYGQEGTYPLGIKLDQNYNFDSKARFYSVGMDLFYKFKFQESCNGFRPLIGVGIKKVTAKLSSFYAPSANTLDSAKFDLNKHKSRILLKLSGGVHYDFNDIFGVRGLISWENTSRLKPSSPKGSTAKLKDSFGATLGMVVKF